MASRPLARFCKCNLAAILAAMLLMLVAGTSFAQVEEEIMPREKLSDYKLRSLSMESQRTQERVARHARRARAYDRSFRMKSIYSEKMQKQIEERDLRRLQERRDFPEHFRNLSPEEKKQLHKERANRRRVELEKHRSWLKD